MNDTGQDDWRGAVSVSGRVPRLFGVTILLVEDSRAASEAVRLMAVASGARLRRADSLETAAQHLAIHQPRVVIVDLGLPDGNGLELLREIAGGTANRPGLIATSGGDPMDWQDDAKAAGADALLPKPVDGMVAFQAAVFAVLPDIKAGGPALASGPDAEISDAALAEDYAFAHSALSKGLSAGNRQQATYAAQFVSSLSRVTQDPELSALSATELEMPDAGARLLRALEQRLNGLGADHSRVQGA